jgi:DNA-binding protein YbaB
MFDKLKGMAGLAGLMKDLPRIKAKFEEVKGRLAQLTTTAETGGGAVRATVNGQMRIVSIEVDQALLAGLIDSANPEDRALASDLIAGAVNAALEKAKEMAAKEMGAAAEELGLPIPPGGLAGMLG